MAAVMNESLHRVAAVAVADFRIRFRRTSTIVVFLLLSAVPYLWIPSPSTGRALLQSDGHRVLYDSPAIGMATALLASIFIGLFGFYVISSAIRRDVISRCGFVIASTRMRNGEYLVGKFAGNLLFLSVFVSGFMLTSMAMLAVRGEAALRPLVFLQQYLLLVSPVIVLVSALAILFESVPLLAGKFGDVVYFFVWLGSMGVVAAQSERDGGASWLFLFDFTGLGYLMENLKATLHTTNISIGSSTFDASKTTLVFPGLTVAGWWWKRALCAAMPLALLPLARLFFHRFDPARVRQGADHARRRWVGRLNALIKPLTRFAHSTLSGSGSGTSLLSAARADALLTLTNFPLTVVAMIAIAIAALASDAADLSSGVLPVALAVLAVAISDVSTRDRRSGTVSLLFASPTLRERYVAWKLASTLMFSFIFVAVPLLRLATEPRRLAAAAVGVAFVAAAATGIGVISGNSKAFIVIFLSFWYIAMNSKGANPGSDFAGFYSVSLKVSSAYFASAAALVAGSMYWHRRRFLARL